MNSLPTILGVVFILLFVILLLYFLLAASTNWLPPITSIPLKAKCMGQYLYGSHMVLPWNQIIEVDGKWVPDEDYTVIRKEYLFGYTKYQVVTPFEDV